MAPIASTPTSAVLAPAHGSATAFADAAHVRPEVLIPLLGIAGVYALGWWRLTRRDRAAASRGIDPYVFTTELLKRNRANVGMVGFAMSEENVAKVLAHPLDGMRDPLVQPSPWVVLFDVAETSAQMDPEPAVEGVLEAAMEHGGVTDAVIAASGRQAHELWALREHVPEAQRLDGPSIKHDISVAVSRIPEFIASAGARLQALMPGIRIVCFGHVGDGNLHYNQSKPRAMDDAAFRAQEDAVHDIVHDVAARLGGSISAEHGIGRLKQHAFLQYKPAVAIDVMQRIKHALDPRGTFNPGRLLPRPGRQPS